MNNHFFEANFLRDSVHTTIKYMSPHVEHGSLLLSSQELTIGLGPQPGTFGTRTLFLRLFVILLFRVPGSVKWSPLFRFCVYVFLSVSQSFCAPKPSWFSHHLVLSKGYEYSHFL